MKRNDPSGPVEAMLLRWKPLTDLASDLGVPYQTVRSWGLRNSIPSRHYLGIIASAKKRGIDGVTADSIAAAHAEAATPSEQAGAA